MDYTITISGRDSLINPEVIFRQLNAGWEPYMSQTVEDMILIFWRRKSNE